MNDLGFSSWYVTLIGIKDMDSPAVGDIGRLSWVYVRLHTSELNARVYRAKAKRSSIHEVLHYAPD